MSDLKRRVAKPSPSMGEGGVEVWPLGWGEKRRLALAPIGASNVTTGANTPNPALPPSRGKGLEPCAGEAAA